MIGRSRSLTENKMPQSIKDAPNLHAPPPKLRLGPGFALVGGYQSYTAFPKSVIPDAKDKGLCRKQTLLAPHFTSVLLSNRSVLDLGANNAFFALWALHNGAAYATAVDMDPQCQLSINQVAEHLNYGRLNLVNGKTQDQKDPHDVVLALALIHWVYSCTADFGSLDRVIAWLAGLARHALVVEWIAPSDGAIANFHHTDFNKDLQREPYTYEAFRAALEKHFATVTLLGPVTDTRLLFLAKKSAAEIDLSGPLPLLEDASKIISSRFLASAGQLQFWSRVYDLGDSILKQTSFDLASREALFLHQLHSSGPNPSFPQSLATTDDAHYSTIRIEKIRGLSLRQASPELTKSPAEFLGFTDACLDILQRLAEKQITHRDIRPDNIIVRDAIPVLLDFGWAISPSRPYHTPAPLQNLPPTCDLIGMAKVIEAAANQKFPTIQPILDNMQTSNPLLSPPTVRQLRAAFHQSLAAN